MFTWWKVARWLLGRVADVVLMAYRVRVILTNDLPHLRDDVQDLRTATREIAEYAAETRSEVRQQAAYCRGRVGLAACQPGDPHE